MRVRPLVQTLLTVAITMLLAIIVGGIVQTFLNGGDVVAAFLTEAPTVLINGGSVALLLILVFLLVANYVGRRGSNGAKFWVQVALVVLADAAGTVAMFMMGLLLGATGGAFAWFVALAGVSAGIWILIGGILALVIVHFAVYRDPVGAE